MSQIKLLFEELGVSIGDIDSVEKGHPFPVPRHAESLLHERRPLRFEGPSDERHIGLVRRPAAFAAIALVTGANDILPNRCATLRAGHDVVKVEVVAGQAPAAVLAGAFVTGIDIVAAEADLSFGHAIVADQKNHPGHAQNTIDQTNGFVMD